MGTRAHVSIKGLDGLYIYTQFDGYPEGLGKALAKILKGHYLVNGFGSEGTVRSKCKAHNGESDLAAWLVMRLKKRLGYPIGNVYLYAGNAATADTGADYLYVIKMANDNRSLDLEVHQVGYGIIPTKCIYNGSVDAYARWLRTSKP
jgi:hypothetical protein